MSGPFGSSQWMYASGGFYPYQIEQSLRFNDDDSAYLSRTPASAGNRKTFTFSAWVKPSAFGKAQPVFSAYTDAQNYSVLGFDLSGFIGGGDSLKLWTGISNVTICAFTTNAVFRDPSAWYHIVVATDTTQATSTDRVKIYVNGSQITSFATSTYPSLNADAGMVNATTAHQIGALASGTYGYFDGYMAEVNFIDGTALDPSSFGETKSGIWVPKAYSGAYGTNGFYLSFANSAAIGDDLSGNGNDWTANNLVSTDVLLDSPTNNFAVFNSTIREYTVTSVEAKSEGNLKISNTGSGVTGSGWATFNVNSGKWYYETAVVAAGGSIWIGWSNDATKAALGTYGSPLRDFGYTYKKDGNKCNNSSTGTAYGATYTTGDIIGVALDIDAGTLEFYKNGVSQGVAFTGVSANGGFIAGVSIDPVTTTVVANFGQDSSFAGNKTAQGNTDANGVGDFYYTPPSGFLALCTANLPDPVIDPAQDDVPADYFNTVLYTGNGSTQSITGVGFQPDFVWGKKRVDADGFHVLIDLIRGGTKPLFSNSTNAEATETLAIQTFDSDGWSMDSWGGLNENTKSYVAWNWLAGNGTASNTDGSITSTVSVNQKAGFSVVSYTGNGTAGATIGHGLGAAPAMMIVKDRDAAQDWVVYHAANTSNPETDRLLLNSTGGTVDANVIWNDTAPTSSVFSVGTSIATNPSGNDVIAYCFAEVEGYSKFGSYTGNGSTDGPFVYCGFRPAFVMVKRTDSTSAWRIWDDARRPNNVADATLYANLSDAEGTGSNENLDILSNGFKLRNLDSAQNASGGTYIFMAFAEIPVKYSGTMAR